MTQHQTQNLDINALRQRLRDSRAESPQGQKYVPAAQTQHCSPPPTNNPHVQRQPSLGDRIEQHKPALTHLHNYWHIYAAIMTFVLFQAISIAPQYFPGTQGMESPYGRAPFLVVIFLTCVPAFAVFFVLRGLRRSLQNAAKITESKNWSQVEWIGAAIGFGLLFYWTFFHVGIMERNMIAEAITGPFELTPREWIMAGVKCVGGAVTGAILARKFFGDFSEE